MSKEKQFEYIEIKIRQAVKNNPPAFNARAWAKMEALLDKEEKKLKPFFWWMMFALLTAGVAYIFNYHNGQPDNIAENILNAADTKQSAKEMEHSTAANMQNIGTKNIFPGDEKQLINNFPSPDKTVSRKVKAAINKAIANVINNNAEIADNKSTNRSNKKTGISKAGINKVTITESNPVDNAAMQDMKNNDKVRIPDVKESTKPGLVKANKNSQGSRSVSALNNHKTSTDANTPAQKNQSIPANKKSSPIYFLASIGPDIGSVKLFSFSNSSLAAKYGVGAGYQLTKRVSLQTGFYTGKKKYIAGPKDYHTKRPLPDTVKIVSVAGDCLVFDIPFDIRYDIVQKSSILYYTILGLSSYVMKNEHYDIYRTVNSRDSSYDTAFSGNRHLFSTLSFSAGIEKQISKSVSLQLEPSVSLPLTGVGHGKVKLFSTAIMLGVKYRPFRK